MTGGVPRDPEEADLERRAGAVHDLARPIPRATASITGTAAMVCAGRDAPATVRRPIASTATARAVDQREDSRRAAGSSSSRGRARGRRRRWPLTRRRRRRRRSRRASPTRPSAIDVVCCGVYQSDRGTLSIRMPPKRPRGDGIDVHVEQRPSADGPRREIDDGVEPLGARGETASATASAAGPALGTAERTTRNSAPIISRPGEHRIGLQVALEVDEAGGSGGTSSAVSPGSRK